MTVQIVASMDNTIFSESQTLSNGSGEHLFAGATSSGSVRRALVRFDIAAVVPAGATITSAELKLDVNRTRVGNVAVKVHRLTADWGEGASNAGANEGAGATAAPGDATWAFRQTGGAQWQSQGGDFIATPSASAMAGSSGSVNWASTAELVADAQGWLDQPGGNFGWILVGPEGGRSAKRFASRENASASSRPTLTITYQAAG